MQKQCRIGIYSLAVWLAVNLGVFDAHAFSLMGPYESWMTPSNGFEELGDIGGPVNIGEGYRWNVPVVTYSFDQSFQDCFGSNGEAAVNSAIQILDNLPPASQLDPATYPSYTTEVNFQAASEGLIDLKSETLFLLLQQMGLAQPQRYMYCVLDFSVTAGSTNVLLTMRNFDPFTFEYTNGLNGALFTNYVVVHSPWGPWRASAIAYAVPISPVTAPYAAVADGWAGQSPGLFYTGLTRDDAGGLRYLIGTNNFQYEPLLPDVQGAGTNAGNFVNAAIRAGVDKITLVQEMMDPLTGEFYVPVTNFYTDTYWAGTNLMQQQLERVSVEPDFVFSASPWNGPPPAAVQMTSTTNWLNEGPPNASGPGIIRPQVRITFPTFGPSAVTITSDSGPIELNSGRWASFDNSTDPPAVYPTGAPGTGNPWTINFMLVNTNYQPLPNGTFTWQLPAAIGTGVRLEVSTNLTNWTPVATVTNNGVPMLWEHMYSQPAEYFQAAPQ